MEADSFLIVRSFCYTANTIAGSSNGRTLGFGPRNLGSSPSPAALLPFGHQGLRHWCISERRL